MRSVVKVAGLLLLLAFILAQFFQPEKNIHEGPSESDLLLVMEVPDQVADLLKNSCYDCHSNHTRYPWYDKISPVSWFLHRHVVEGKEALNFSEFGHLGQRKMISALSGICEVIEDGSMPLVSYRLIHRNAALNDEDVTVICDWSESKAEQLMRSGLDSADP